MQSEISSYRKVTKVLQIVLTDTLTLNTFLFFLVRYKRFGAIVQRPIEKLLIVLLLSNVIHISTQRASQ